MTEPNPVGRPANPADTSTDRGRFAAALRAARLAAGLTVPEAADRIGVAASTWYDWEVGRHIPPITTLAAIAAALGCAVGELFPRERGRRT